MEILVTRAKRGIPTGELLFVFTKMLVFQDQYIQFVLCSPSKAVATFGFCESSRLTQYLEENITYTLWNTDWPSASFSESLYDSHSFYMQVTSSGKAHGVFLMNSNAMDVKLSHSEEQGSQTPLECKQLVVLWVFTY
jgi:hypothetical protein